MGKTKFNRYKGVRKRRKVNCSSSQEEAQETVAVGPDNRIQTIVEESATSKKLGLFDLTIEKMLNAKEQTYAEQDEDGNCYLLVEKKSLNDLLGCLCCPQCKKPGVKFDTVRGKDMGLCSKGFIYCGQCEEVVNTNYLSERIGDDKSTKKPFEVNIRAVFAFMGIGCGLSAINDWCTTRNIPSGLNKTSFRKQRNI